MRRSRRKIQARESFLDMTSLMDIIFILLIFVMLSVSFSKNFNYMELDIPSAKNGAGKEQNDITINVKTTGDIFLEKEKIEWSLLEKQVSSGSFKNKSVLLNIEKKVPFQEFMKIADILKTGEIKKLNLGIKE